MPTPCSIMGRLAAGMPICCAAALPENAEAMRQAIQSLLLRIGTSLFCRLRRLGRSWRRCLGRRRLATRQNVVQVVVRGQALGGEKIDGAINGYSHGAILLVHPGIR